MFQRTKKTVFFFCAAVLLTVSICADCGAYQYDAQGRRDPFVPLIGVADASSVSGARGILTIEDVSLQGIVTGPNGKRAVVINGELMNEGQKVERLLVESIGDNVVMIKIDEERFYLKLYE